MLRRLGLALAFVTALVTSGPSTSTVPPPVHEGPPPALGQWVWTRSDLALLPEAATPGIFVGTVEVTTGTLGWTRALSPTLAGDGPRAAVLRFDDSLHSHWDDPGFGDALSRQLQAIVDEVDVDEIQLDYDAPTRRLQRWGALVRKWGRGPLLGRRVWVTSIPTHLADPQAYRRAFAGAVDGHILQVFDTELACTPEAVSALSTRIARAELPYRIGVGAFERGNRTDHGCWLRHWRHLGHAAGFDGLWVFPAGQAYHHLIDS